MGNPIICVGCTLGVSDGNRVVAPVFIKKSIFFDLVAQNEVDQADFKHATLFHESSDVFASSCVEFVGVLDDLRKHVSPVTGPHRSYVPFYY